jgi:hypothetical protein
MQHENQLRSGQQVTEPDNISSPTAREMRGQAVHRLQVGLFGLCAMLLIVGLANIIMDRARLAEDDSPAAEIDAAPPPKAAADPLADMGVVPGADPSAASSPPKDR